MGRQRQMVRAALHLRAGRGERTVTDQKARGGRLETVPLPAGFGVVFDGETQFVGSDVLFGGSPPRLMRLNAAGVRALDELRAGRVRTADGGRLARRLTDAGLAHPRPPVTDAGLAHPGPPTWPGPAEVTVVIPVRDRTAGLDRCLAALGHGFPAIVVDDGPQDPAAVAAACAAPAARPTRRPGPRRP